MEASKILSADFLDILFEGRNKLYGAYDLRKSYPGFMERAMIIIGMALLVIIFFVSIHRPVENYKVFDFIPEVVPGKVPPPPVPPPPPPSVRQVGSANSNNSFLPTIVRDSTRADSIQTNDETELVSFSGNPTGDLVPSLGSAPVTPEILPLAERPVDNMDNDDVKERVDVPAQFPGGMKGWVDYLKRNLDAETPVDNGAPAGTYSVGIRFIVSREGMISKVQAETRFGYGMEAEAMKVISKCPKWIPALQNGRKVNAFHRQVITFVVNE